MFFRKRISYSKILSYIYETNSIIMANENTNSSLLKFFGELATYFRKENDLSDVTVALCNADNEFKEIFLKFFFPQINVSEVSNILREVPDDSAKDSRVDILIKTNDENISYLIEVKIYDQNHHFGQYEKAYRIPKERFGYITNYNCKKEGYVIKTWEEFYNNCCKNSNNPFIKAYGEYLKNVCGIDRYANNPMKIREPESEACFADTVQKIIVNYDDDALAARYDKKYPNKSAFGFDFGRQNNLSGYAIYYANFCEKPEIALVLHARYFLEKPVLNEAESLAADAEYFGKPYKRNLVAPSNVWIPLKEKKLKEFDEAPNYQTQKKILEEFFNEVLSKLSKYF